MTKAGRTYNVAIALKNNSHIFKLVGVEKEEIDKLVDWWQRHLDDPKDNLAVASLAGVGSVILLSEIAAIFVDDN